jgi:membrane fusion protein, multidrug efflux system
MKKVLIFLLVAAGVFAAWFWFKSSNAPVAEEASERPVASVETAVLADQPIAQTIEVFGVMVAAPSGDHVTSAPYDCVVRKIYVGVGTPVTAGEVLLEVEPSPEAKLAADSARSLLVLATKSLAATQQRYDLKLATNQELLTAQQAADDAQLKADSFAARGLGGDGRITAPAAGVVTHLDLFAGALAPTGTALVTVSTGGQMEARLGIEAAEVGVVASGQTVTLESSNRANPETVASTVRTVGAALDPATGTAEVRTPVPTGAPLLFGEHVRAQIQVQQKDHALVVPRSAVLPDDEKHVLFTVKNGLAVRHEVKTGLSTDDLIEVSGEGLQAGDLVVTLGNYELEDGMAVQLPEKEKSVVKSEQEAKP